jgi:predicted nucleic acid-binding protein
MPVAYLHTSAAMKALFDESESEALVAYLTDQAGRTLVASWLLHTELHCAAGRRADLAASSLSAVLGMIDLIDITRGDLISAGTQMPLRSNDAIHLATALRVGADDMITYDLELADAAERAGLRVVSPGG